MKTKIYIVIIFSTFFFYCSHIPSLKISNQYLFIGKIKGGDSVNIEIPLYNDGSAKLKIIGVSSSCNCIIAQDTNFEIKPGESYSFNLKLITDTTEINTIVSKSIALRTNSEDTITFLKISYFVY
jgi:hypothetical protein